MKSINFIKSWNFYPIEKSEYVKKYNMIAKQIQDILTFTHNGDNSLFPNLLYNTVFTSHEALVLDYENAFLVNEKYHLNYIFINHMFHSPKDFHCTFKFELQIFNNKKQ